MAFISFAAGNTHRAIHGKETVYTECPYKYFQCTFYTRVMETFHSSVQSLGNSSAQLQAWPKNKGDAHLLSPLAQPESSPAWAAAGASGDVLLETLCMALGLEPGGTVTLQTDRHSWGAQGDNPLALLGHQGGWEGRCPWDCMREMLPLHQHAGERYQRGDPSSTGQKHRGTNGGGGETCTYHCPHLPPALGCTAQEGRRDVSELPYCPESRCSDRHPQYRLCRRAASPNCTIYK